MPVITLTTEWNINDFYVGAVKGALLSKGIDNIIIDITHNITKFSIIQAAFILRSCYKQFPESSVHVICVNSELTDKNKHVAVKHNNHYFVCSDNGILGLLFDSQPDIVVKLASTNEHVTFPELNVFPQAVSHLIKGKNINDLGEEQSSINRQIAYMPTIDEHGDNTIISGKVIYIDSYENAITNINKDLFVNAGKGRKFVIYLQNNIHLISKINNSYFETEDGELIALFNSLNLLEIAIKYGSVKQFFKLDVDSQIRIEFL